MKEISQEDTKNKTCIKCNVELILNDNWYESLVSQGKYECKSCVKKSAREYAKTTNKTQMYVNGKYISKKHPLYKAGRYKSFGDAAFSSLQKDKKVKEGYVYAMVNPAWPDWIKIGMAIDADDRLNGYQTSSPMRDYTLIYYVFSNNRSKDERKAHKLAEKIADRRGEWFKISQDKAIEILKEISNG